MTRRPTTPRKDVSPDSSGPDAEAEIAAPEISPEVMETVLIAPVLPDEVSVVAKPPLRSGMLGPVLGGALAAIGGFGLSHFNVFGLSLPNQTPDLVALSERLDAAFAALEARQASQQTAQTEALEDLTARVEAVEVIPAADLSGLDDLDQRLQAIEELPPGGDASTVALATKLADLERKLAAAPAAGADTAEVEAALARLAAVEAEAQARADAATAAAEAATEARAHEVLAAAAATAAGFEAELAAVADPDLQARLAPFVAGVASMADLQVAFPDAARTALQVARGTDETAGWTTRLMDFLGAQTGARSLSPRDGDGADAILSRAEFALGEGRLADALAELAALSPEVQAPLADWRALAEARLAVDTALAGEF